MIKANSSFKTPALVALALVCGILLTTLRPKPRSSTASAIATTGSGFTDAAVAPEASASHARMMPSGIHGVVLQRPARPVGASGAAGEAPAADVDVLITGPLWTPFSGASVHPGIETTNPDAEQTYTATTGSDGTLDIGLIPGRYLVRTRHAIEVRPRTTDLNLLSAAPPISVFGQTITVVANHYAEVTIHIDTGLRFRASSVGVNSTP